MPRTIELIFQGSTSCFEMAKVERGKLYGCKKRVWLDAKGRECAEARLTEDGRHILPRGSTAQLYVDETGETVSSKTLIAADGNGAPLEMLPSTLGAGQDVSGPVPIEEFLNHRAVAMYQLDAVDIAAELETALRRGDIFRVPFRIRPTHRDSPGFLLMNDEGVFLVVAEPTRFEFIGRESAAKDPAEEDSMGGEPDDFDFGTF